MRRVIVFYCLSFSLFFINDLYATVFFMTPKLTNNLIVSSGDFIDSKNPQNANFCVKMTCKYSPLDTKFNEENVYEKIQLYFRVCSSLQTKELKKFNKDVKISIMGGNSIKLLLDGKTIISPKREKSYSKIYHFEDKQVKQDFILKIEIENKFICISFRPLCYRDKKTNLPASDPFTCEIISGKMVIGDIVICSIPILKKQQDSGIAVFHLEKQQQTVIFKENKQTRKLLNIKLNPIISKDKCSLTFDNTNYYENLAVSLNTVFYEQKYVNEKWVAQDRYFYSYNVLRLYSDMKILLLGASLSKTLDRMTKDHQYHFKRVSLPISEACPFYRGQLEVKRNKNAIICNYFPGFLKLKITNQKDQKRIKISCDEIIFAKKQYQITPILFYIKYQHFIWKY